MFVITQFMTARGIADGIDINNARNIQGAIALHLATQRGHQEIAKVLLENGSDVNATDSDGNTALHAAVGKGYQEIAKLLLQHRANKNIKNKNGETAADLAKEEEIKDLINNWKS